MNYGCNQNLVGNVEKFIIFSVLSCIHLYHAFASYIILVIASYLNMIIESNGTAFYAHPMI